MALNQVVMSLARYLLANGIAVAAISPGWVRTDSGVPNALIDVKTSVSGMIKVIEELNIEKTGLFADYVGNIIPW